MEIDKNEGKPLTIYQTVISGAEEILKKIEEQSWNKKLLLKNDAFLKNEKYQKTLLDKIVFFTPGEEIEEITVNVTSLFQTAEQETAKDMQIIFRRKSNIGSPVKIFLEIRKEPYRIPFEMHLIPFPGHEIFPQKKNAAMTGKQENFTYQMFPPEEFLTLAFYEIIKDLELIKDMSWYKEVYEILCKEPVDGRKVWENMNRLTREYPIPSFEKRLDTFIGYKDYGYMKRRWKSQSKRAMEPYPQWKKVIELLSEFFTPIFEGVLKDEVFLGDWMPELGRYLD